MEDNFADMPPGPRPLVSVIVTAYQHAPFIAQCLEGILMQQTSFPVEVLVGEDESTDGTREICERFAVAHPERIHLFLRSRKDVLQIMGKPTGRANMLDLLHEARGTHIAFCEGDDHWIDPLKLQKQVDLLEADPAATGCFTDAWNEHDGQRTNYFDGVYATAPKHDLVTEADVMAYQNFPWCTTLFRREALFPLPEILWRSAVGDTVIYVHATRAGHLRYLPEHTGVRVMHPGGIHSLTSKLNKLRVKEQLWPLLDEMTLGRYHEQMIQRLHALYMREWNTALATNDEATLKHIWPRMYERRSQYGWSLPRTMLSWARSHFPFIRSLLYRRS